MFLLTELTGRSTKASLRIKSCGRNSLANTHDRSEVDRLAVPVFLVITVPRPFVGEDIFELGTGATLRTCFTCSTTNQRSLTVCESEATSGVRSFTYASIFPTAFRPSFNCKRTPTKRRQKEHNLQLFNIALSRAEAIPITTKFSVVDYSFNLRVAKNNYNRKVDVKLPSKLH